MHLPARHSHSETVALVSEALRRVSPTLDQIGPDTQLVGDGAALDSLAFVTFLVDLEQRVGHQLDLSTPFMELGDAADHNPFRTLGSLADYVHAWLSEHPDRQ